MMRINSVQLAHALAKSQSSIRPIAELKIGGQLGSEGIKSVASQKQSIDRRKSRDKKSKKKTFNADSLGLHVDEWV